ncbi:DUF916 and DUF3324 domain-containing protein [Vagococcus fluvialis]|uniref:DUF916 and DUF3324 domain-containing protein n=1 Tax=Vagococcus fluvialis TaxID=2738 RepID=UPI0037A73D36
MRRISLIISLIFCFILMPIKSSANSSNFGIRPIYPATQAPDVGESGYFMLDLHPKQKEILEIEVTNYSSNPISVLAEIGRAQTSDSGLISYDLSLDNNTEIDDSVNFNKMIDLTEKKIDLKEKETKKLSISVMVPEKEFKGEVLGGIHFKEIDTEDTKPRKMVTNKFSYSIPIIIRNNDNKIENELSIVNVEPALRNYHPYIHVNIKNSALSIIRNMKIKGEIFNLDKKEKWYVRHLDNLQMAPYSDFNFGFDLKDSEILPGNYEVILDINADGKEYKLKKEFNITKSDAKEKNENSVFVEQSHNDYLVIISIAVVLILFVLILTIFLLKKNKTNKKKRIKKRKYKL